MDGICNDVHEHDKCLRNFFSSVQWNTDASSCVKQLLAEKKKGRLEKYPEDDEDKNPYSDEPLLPPPYAVYSVTSPKADSRITIDADLQRKILKPFWKSDSEDTRTTPVSLAHEWLLFTREERVALYQYALQHTRPPPSPPELKLQLESETEVSGDAEAALRKQQRDLRRRRQAYRTAATGSKTLTEVTREVIHNIMELIGVSTDTPKQKDAPHTQSSVSATESSNFSVSSGSGQGTSANKDLQTSDRKSLHQYQNSRRQKHRGSPYSHDRKCDKRSSASRSKYDKRREESRIGNKAYRPD